MKTFDRLRKWSHVAAFGLVLTAPVLAFSDEDDLGALAEQLIQLRGEVETLHDQIESEQQDHRNRMSSLSQRRAELQVQIERQELELEKARRQIDELRQKSKTVDDESAALQPVATNSAKKLETHVKSSLPFTSVERVSEIDGVRSKLSKGEVSAPRALNQLWTFVEDELRLSKENGLFRQTITIDGEEQLADIVRVGMVMLFFRTGDGRYGHATQQGDNWTYTVVEGEAAEKLELLFDDFEKQVRTGFFTVPNALPGGAR